MSDSLNGIYVINVMKSNKMKMMMDQNNICIINNKAMCFQILFPILASSICAQEPVGARGEATESCNN